MLYYLTCDPEEKSKGYRACDSPRVESITYFGVAGIFFGLRLIYCDQLFYFIVVRKKFKNE
jgi:hypothetical protein